MKIISTIEKYKELKDVEGFEFNEPATNELILEVENSFGIKLSDDLVYFYKSMNGLEANDNWIFRILSLEEIIEKYHETFDTSFVFAEYAVYSDTWQFVFSKNEKITPKIVSFLYNPEIKQTTHKVFWPIDFCEFLEIYLDKGLDGLLKKQEEFSKNPSNLEELELLIKENEENKIFRKSSLKLSETISKLEITESFENIGKRNRNLIILLLSSMVILLISLFSSNKPLHLTLVLFVPLLLLFFTTIFNLSKKPKNKFNLLLNKKKDIVFLDGKRIESFSNIVAIEWNPDSTSDHTSSFLEIKFNTNEKLRVLTSTSHMSEEVLEIGKQLASFCKVNYVNNNPFEHEIIWFGSNVAPD